MSPLPSSFLRILSLAALAALALRAPARAESDLVANDNFADGGASWTLQSPPGASGDLSVVKEADGPALCIATQKDGEAASDVRISRLFGDLNADANYHLRFKIKSAEPAKVVAFICPKSETSRVLFRREIDSDPDWREYSFDFKGSDSATDCLLGFAHLDTVPTKYYFKDITLTMD